MTMLLFRSLTIGLLGACVLLLARVGPSRTTIVTPPALAPASSMPKATIVDLAPGVSSGVVASLIRLAPGEHVVAVDDRAVKSDLDAGAAITGRPRGTGSFVDLEVAAPDGAHRRVLVLMH